jgi:uncharacterized protein YxeA
MSIFNKTFKALLKEAETLNRKELFIQELKELLKKHRADLDGADDEHHINVYLYPVYDKDGVELERVYDFDINLRHLS